MKTTRQQRAEIERRLAAQESQEHAEELELQRGLAEDAALRARHAATVYDTDAEVFRKIGNPHPFPLTMDDA